MSKIDTDTMIKFFHAYDKVGDDSMNYILDDILKNVTNPAELKIRILTILTNHYGVNKLEIAEGGKNNYVECRRCLTYLLDKYLKMSVMDIGFELRMRTYRIIYADLSYMKNLDEKIPEHRRLLKKIEYLMN